jgi:MFS family permease
MLWLAAPLLPAALLMLTLKEPARTERAIRRPTTSEIWRALWSYRRVIGPLLFGLVMVEVAIGAVLIWAAPAFMRNFALSPERVGALMAAGLMISGIVGPLAGGSVADMCHRLGGPRRTVLMLSLLTAVSVPAGAFALASNDVVAGALLIVFMTLTLAVAVIGLTLFTIVIPNELRGLCMAVMVALNILFALGIAPVTVSLLSGALGGVAMIDEALALVCVTTGILATGIFASGRRHLPAGPE